MADASLILTELHKVPLPNVKECPDFHWEGTEKQKDAYRTKTQSLKALNVKTKGFF